MTIKDDIKAIAARHPGRSAPEIADYLGRDPRNTRRDIAELRDRGELIARKDEGGVDRYYSGGYQHEVRPVLENVRPRSGQVIDADFRELSAPSSTSRALIPAGQPYDSRVQAALAQHTAARSRANRPAQSPLIPYGFQPDLNSLFVRDPDGDETLAALAGAIAANTVAVQAADARDDRFKRFVAVTVTRLEPRLFALCVAHDFKISLGEFGKIVIVGG